MSTQSVQYNNNYVDTTNWSDVTPTLALVSGSVLSFTVPGLPSAQQQALFSFNDNANVYVGYNVVPTVPASDTINANGRYTEFRPKKRYVSGGDVLYFITPDTVAYVGVSFRTLRQG